MWSRSPPSPGEVLITPASGQGVKTMFTIEAANFHDEDVPLSYRFGYREDGGRERGRIVWFKRISSSHPSVQTLLPASEAAGLTIVVEVCDAFETCVSVESEQRLVVAAAELADSELLQLATEAATRASDQECGEALSLVTQVVQTVARSSQVGQIILMHTNTI